MILELIGALVLPPLGYGLKRQLEINQDVTALKAQLPALKETADHTRSRVDALYDHFIDKP